MFFNIFILLKASAQVCPSFKCADLPQNECLSYQNDTNSYLVSQCPSGLYCAYNASLPAQSVNCTLTPRAIYYPGEPCLVNSDCNNNLCLSNHTCAGLAPKSICSSTLQCQPGYYCAYSSLSPTSSCSLLLTAGQSGCTHSSDCSNLAYCNYTGIPETSFCIGSLSLLPGVIVSTCFSGINYLCQYTTCSLRDGKYYCTSNVMSLGVMPVKCETNRDCMSTSDLYVGGFYLAECSCALNSAGSSYCSLFPGDSPYDAFVLFLSLWLSSPNITNCNSRRRMDTVCIDTYFKYSDILLYYYYYVFNFAELQGNTECVKETLTYNYWTLEELIANQTFHSSGLALAVAFYFLL